MKLRRDYKVIVMGASSGGMKLISSIVQVLPENFCIPILVVLHIHDSSDGSLAELLNAKSKVTVKEADEKEVIMESYVYLAPANYHLLLEPDLSLTLTVDERVNYARPSVDVLFETAAESCHQQVIGIIGTGANSDGAGGLRHIKECGGLAIAQDPKTAEAPSMPLAAIKAAHPHFVLAPEGIINLLLKIHTDQTASYEFKN